jgi:argininosuccinate lyase
MERGFELDELSLDELRSFSNVIENDVFAALTLDKTLATKSTAGGTAPQRVAEALRVARELL